jgi:hypothetical protein
MLSARVAQPYWIKMEAMAIVTLAVSLLIIINAPDALRLVVLGYGVCAEHVHNRHSPNVACDGIWAPGIFCPNFFECGAGC